MYYVMMLICSTTVKIGYQTSVYATSMHTELELSIYYSNSAWSRQLQPKGVLTAINRRAFRWCFNYRKYDQISECMFLNNWPTMESRRSESGLRFYMLIVGGEACVDDNKFIQNHQTRFGGTKGNFNTDVKKHFFHHRVHSDINS